MPAERSAPKHTTTHTQTPYTKPPSPKPTPPTTEPTKPSTPKPTPPAYPTGGRFRPEFENLDHETDLAYKALATLDPYTHYKMHTGMKSDRTLERIHEFDPKYAQWMLDKHYADLAPAHILKRAMDTLLTKPGVRAPLMPVATLSSAAPAIVGDAKFKDGFGKPMWITMADVIGVFHMSERQVKARLTQLPKRSYVVRVQKFWLKDVYGLARRVGRPLAGTAEEAVELYREKVRRCGNGDMEELAEYCSCNACEDMRSGGKSQAGQRFWLEQVRGYLGR